MGSFSIWHWIVVLVVVVLIFGAGKLPNVMGDVAKGIKSFKRNLNDENADDTKHVTDDGHAKEPHAATRPEQRWALLSVRTVRGADHSSSGPISASKPVLQ